MQRLIALLILFFCSQCNAWNTVGHQLIAKIAYDNLTPQAKLLCIKALHSDNKHLESDMISVSGWLDYIRISGRHEFDHLHYIDIPYPEPNHFKMKDLKGPNALSAIKNAIKLLSPKNRSNAQKNLNLRILIHVVGDVHQPLHTTTRLSRKYPNGDYGANLFKLTNNSISNNLHGYWDKGAGLFLPPVDVIKTGEALEKKYSCEQANLQKKPEEWIANAHQLAITYAYTLDPNSKPSKEYQEKAKRVIERQIVMAGCRLANLLNNIANSLVYTPALNQDGSTHRPQGPFSQ